MSVCVYRNIGSVWILSDKYAAYTQKGFMLKLRPFFFDYLVYGSADPILQDFEKKKKLN